jgi:hypothetical protein
VQKLSISFLYIRLSRFWVTQACRLERQKQENLRAGGHIAGELAILNKFTKLRVLRNMATSLG